MDHEAEHIFVYGTLRRGSWNNRLLHDAEFMGSARTRGSYALYVDGLPYVVREPEVSAIAGEVYALPARFLPRLDALEGHPDLYQRERIAYRLDDGRVGEAWLYFYPRPEGALVPSGDYFEWVASQRDAEVAGGETCYFAYGADMAAEQMHARCHGAVYVGAACLPGYALRVSAHGLLDVTPRVGEEVYGAVWRLTGPMAGILERFQRADLGEFDRALCEVALLDGGICTAAVYSAREHVSRQPLKPGYRMKAVAGARAAGLPSFYVEALEVLS
jgi:gamma-glutamylcyclotransferase (GGCT)/AIG2-like uncharacterized protein YtfP